MYVNLKWEVAALLGAIIGAIIGYLTMPTISQGMGVVVLSASIVSFINHSIGERRLNKRKAIKLAKRG